MIVNKKVFLKEISKALLKLVLAGVIIGIFKKYDAILAILLLSKVLQNCYKEIIKPQTNKNWILLIGMFLTGFAGIVGETWGVKNGFWKYHEV